MTTQLLSKIQHDELKSWILKQAEQMQADDIYVCDGSKEEYDAMCKKLVEKGTFIRLNQQR